jgi:hypothetical protein
MLQFKVVPACSARLLGMQLWMACNVFFTAALLGDVEIDLHLTQCRKRSKDAVTTAASSRSAGAPCHFVDKLSAHLCVAMNIARGEKWHT